MKSSFLSRWRILPILHYTNWKVAQPNAGPDCWKSWLSVSRYWSGKLVYINARHHQLVLDFRRNWVADMINPTR